MYFPIFILAILFIPRGQDVQCTTVASAAAPSTAIAVSSVTAASAATTAAVAVPATVLTLTVAVPAIIGLTLFAPFLIPIIGTEAGKKIKKIFTKYNFPLKTCFLNTYSR
jgi:Flp pilus assembly secretin CpaC